MPSPSTSESWRTMTQSKLGRMYNVTDCNRPAIYLLPSLRPSPPPPPVLISYSFSFRVFPSPFSCVVSSLYFVLWRSTPLVHSRRLSRFVRFFVRCLASHATPCSLRRVCVAPSKSATPASLRCVCTLCVPCLSLMYLLVLSVVSTLASVIHSSTRRSHSVSSASREQRPALLQQPPVVRYTYAQRQAQMDHIRVQYPRVQGDLYTQLPDGRRVRKGTLEVLSTLEERRAQQHIWEQYGIHQAISCANSLGTLEGIQRAVTGGGERVHGEGEQVDGRGV
jgi:hypothetical protein